MPNDGRMFGMATEYVALWFLIVKVPEGWKATTALNARETPNTFKLKSAPPCGFLNLIVPDPV